MENELNSGKRNNRNDKLLLFGVLFLMLSLSFITFKPTLTGMFTLEGESEYVLELNKNYTANTTAQLNINNIVTSIRLNGQYVGEFKLWLNDSGRLLLIAESNNNDNSNNLITGLGILDVGETVQPIAPDIPEEFVSDNISTEESTESKEPIVIDSIVDSNESGAVDTGPEPSILEDDIYTESNVSNESSLIDKSVLDMAENISSVIFENISENILENISESVSDVVSNNLTENVSTQSVSVDALSTDILNETYNASIVEELTTNESVVNDFDIDESIANVSIIDESLINKSVMNESTMNVSMINKSISSESVLENLTLNETIPIIPSRIAIELLDECIDTCRIDLNITDANLVIELSENSTLSIDSLIYTQEVPANDTNITVETIQYPARVGEPVKWVKKASRTTEGEISVDIPASAYNVSTYKRLDKVHRKAIASEIGKSSKKRLLGKGTKSADNESILKIVGSSTNVEIEYYTEAPSSSESVIEENRKKILVSSDTHYTNVTVNATLPFEVKNANQILLKWIVNDSIDAALYDLSSEESSMLNDYGFVEIDLPFTATDSDGNDLYDSVEWIAPHLSDQIFEIIVITKAIHLDENKSFISDIYEQVRAEDDVWSEIANNEYVRVTFEKNLTSENDITIYARSNSSGRVFVYEKESDILLADFGEIIEDKKYQVFLTNLTQSRDVFDLRVLNGTVEFDYIVDPIIYPNVVGTAVTFGYGSQDKMVRLDSGELISVWIDAANDLWCSNSLDNGIRWVNKEIVDVVTYITPAIVTNGSRIIVFAVDNLTAENDIVTAYSDSGCSDVFTFVDVSGMNESVGALNFTHPASAVGPNNNISLCAIGNGDDLYFSYSEDFGVSFVESSLLDDVNNDECDIEVDSNGMVWIVVADRDIDDVFLFNSSDGFNTFTTTTIELGGADMFPSIAIGSDDAIYLTWTNAGNNQFKFANSSNGATWSIQTVSTEASVVGDTLYAVVKVNNDTGEIYVFYDQDINSAEYAVFLANSSDGGISWSNRLLHRTSGSITADDAYLTAPRGSRFPASNRITGRWDYIYVDDIGTSFEAVFESIPDNYPELDVSGLMVTANTNALSAGYAVTRIFDKEQGLVSDRNLSGGTYSGSARSWQKLRCLENRSECILLWSDVQNDINFEIYTIYDAVWNNYTLLANATLDDNTKPFDVECEDMSGECLMVYTSNGTQNVTSIAYRIYNDLGLSEQFILENLTDFNGTLEWATLYPKPYSDEIMLGIEDSNLDIYAILWNGTNNSFIESVKLNATYAGPVADRKSFDFAWEGSSGDGLLTYGKTTDGLFAYTFVDYVWQDVGSIYALGARAYNIDICGSSPLMNGTNHDYIGIIIEDQDADVNGMMWNGTAVESGNPTEDASAEGLTATQYARCMWESLSKNQAVFLWIDLNNLTASGGSYTIGSGWDFTSFEDDNQTGIATFSDDIDDLSMYPYLDSDEIFILGQDIAEDVNFFIWNGTWFDSTIANYHNPLEVIAPNSAFQSETFDFVRYSMPPNTPPNITYVISIEAINPIESSQTVIEFNFTVNDAQGNDTINVSSAVVLINNSGTTRQSTACNGVAINYTAQNISCNVSLQYYDPAGVWDVNISISDTMNNYTQNTSTTFTYNTLYAIVLNTNLLDFGSLNAGDVDKTAGTLTLNNTGNFNYTLITLKAYDLVNDTHTLSAPNFRINITDSSVGTVLSNDTFINITDATLPRSTNSSIGNQSMYVYVDIPLGTAAKKYNSLLDW
ncbi:MAG: hypothetical protein ACP5OA_01600, partial [Candidatus Woesearchaeota archaeon]